MSQIFAAVKGQLGEKGAERGDIWFLSQLQVFYTTIHISSYCLPFIKFGCFSNLNFPLAIIQVYNQKTNVVNSGFAATFSTGLTTRFHTSKNRENGNKGDGKLAIQEKVKATLPEIMLY